MESDAQLVRELHAELITRREENERLVKELKQCKAELAAATAAKHAPALRRTLSTPKSAVPLTDEELAAMHATFSLFAGDSGAVKAADLQRLHQALGEPLSDEEAREAVAIMAGGREAADFDAFLNYWASTGPYGDRYPRLLTPASSAAAASPASAAPSGAAAAPVSGGAGSAAAGALVPSPLAVDPETRERKRQWYQVSSSEWRSTAPAGSLVAACIDSCLLTHFALPCTTCCAGALQVPACQARAGCHRPHSHGNDWRGASSGCGGLHFMTHPRNHVENRRDRVRWAVRHRRWGRPLAR